MTQGNIDLAFLEKAELFSNLSRDYISFVSSRCEALNLPKGKTLFSSGGKAERFFILTSGVIRVFSTGNSGNEHEMAVFTAGDTIGDFDFVRGAVYDASAEAAEDSQLIVFPGSGHSMESISYEKPDITCSLLLNSIVMMTGRIKSANQAIVKDMSWVHELDRQAYEDPGTGLWKQAIINDKIAGTLQEPSALIMLKPNHFKTLVDSRGHSAGDEAMLKIALIMKNITRNVGHGWALRFKSNEVGLIFNDFDAAKAQKVAEELAAAIASMEPVPAMESFPEFRFSATISWAVWPDDDLQWDSLFQGNYASLLDTWRAGGETVVRYTKAGAE